MVRKALVLSSVLSLLTLSLASCGGGSEGGDGGSAGSGGSGTTSNTTSGTGGTVASGGSGGGTNSGGSAGGTSSGGAGGAGGATTTTTTSSGSGGSSSVVCDSMTCATPNTYCCDHYNQPAECLAPGTDCTYGVPVSCDGPEDCADGQVCCATLYTKGAGNSYESMDCASTCTGKDFRVVCGSSGMCPQGQTCGVSELQPPYLDCK